MDPNQNLSGTVDAEARLAASAAAVSGDAATLYHLVSGLMDEGVPFDSVLFDLLVPVQQAVGTRWQTGEYLVAEEHAATATVETVVSLLAGAFDQPTQGRYVVIAAAEGDHHSLPARLVAAYLVFLGYRTTLLGANVLADDLGDYLEVEPPEALIVSCAMSGHLLGARATIRASHSAGIPVIAGGKGFGASGEWAGPVGADTWAADPRQIPDLLDLWQPDPARSEAGARDPTPELNELIAHRTAVLAAAQGLLDRSLPTAARIRDELLILQAAVEASLLVGDDGPAIDTLAWQAATLTAHQVHQADAIAAALGTALGDISPAGAAVLARSLDARGAADQV
jgi:methanogenic corrinoid protein MtbC1